MRKTTGRKAQLKKCDNCAPNPDHSKDLPRVNRLRGQIDGVARMISERRYCPDIIIQIQAIRAALLALQTELLKKHLEHCVRDAFESPNGDARSQKIEELLTIFSKT